MQLLPCSCDFLNNVHKLHWIKWVIICVSFFIVNQLLNRVFRSYCWSLQHYHWLVQGGSFVSVKLASIAAYASALWSIFTWTIVNCLLLVLHLYTVIIASYYRIKWEIIYFWISLHQHKLSSACIFFLVWILINLYL